MYKYNSFHKVITVILVVAWAVWQFMGLENKELEYDNGQKIRSGNLINNKKNGVWKWYFENGKVNILGHYKNGDRVGEWKIYDADGNLIQEKRYKKDKIDGYLINYNKNGEVIQKVLYRKGEPVEQIVKQNE